MSGGETSRDGLRRMVGLPRRVADQALTPTAHRAEAHLYRGGHQGALAASHEALTLDRSRRMLGSSCLQATWVAAETRGRDLAAGIDEALGAAAEGEAP